MNSTISGNTASASGGGIYSGSTSGTITIQNSTIAYNTAQNGGGIYRISGTFNITNTILGNNIGTSSAPDCAGTMASVNYSLIENMSGCTITSESNNLNVDPLIDSSLTGTMQVHALLGGSPAFNAGTSTGCPATDQRGVSRPQGGVCDIGAYEYEGSGIPVTVDVSSGSPQAGAISAAYGSPLIARVEDESGFPVSGISVTFAAPASGASGVFASTGTETETVITNASGLATASTFTANSTEGSFIVEAVVSGIAAPAQFQLENYTPAATTISVSAGSPQTADAGTAYATAIAAVIRDQHFNPMQGITVTFTAPGSGASGIFADTSNNITTSTTDGIGIATASTFTANSTAGSFIVEATVTGIASPAQFQLENLIRVPTTLSINAGSPQLAEINTAYATQLRVLVRDQYSTPMQGITVTFTAPASGASGTFADTSNNTTTAITNASGIASASVFTANGTTGSYIVEASVSGIASPAQFQLENFIRTPTTISVNAGSPQSSLIGKAYTTLFKVLVRDQFSAPMQGITVTFTAPASGASGTFTDSGTNATNATTNASGIATASVFTANNTTGSYVVEASATGIASPALFQLENSTLEPTTISINTGSPQTTQPNTAFALPLSVRVLDQFSNPMEGITVTFTAPASGASGTFSNSGTNEAIATTNSSGIATSSIFTANNAVGEIAVDAAVANIASPVRFRLISSRGLYVSPSGTNLPGCTNPASPCKTLQYAVAQAASGATIYASEGTYTTTSTGSNVVYIAKNLAFSGGWDPTFSTQNGSSIIDGQGVNNNIYVYSGYTVVIDSFNIQNGKTYQGGGIHILNANFTLKNSTVRNNTATGTGGGLFANKGTITIINSTFSGNTAPYGAGLYLDSNTTTILIHNSTIAYNSATTSGGGIAYGYSATTITVTNSIIAHNTSPASGPDCSGIDLSSYNIIGDTSGCTVTAGSGDQFNIDPLITDSLIGPRQVHALLPGSPAINAGTSTGCPVSDQRGIDRDGFCDIGSYEYTAPGPATSLFIVSGNGQRTVPRSDYTNPLVVNVLDASGSPVSGAVVTFTAPSSGASGTFSDTGTNITTVTTDAQGTIISPIFIANSQLGAYVVSASTPGVGSTANFGLENAAWYASTTGNDSNDCKTPETACLTVYQAVTKATAGEVVFVAAGTYNTSPSSSYMVSISKSITLSGGWNNTFDAQTGYSIIDGGSAKRGIYIYKSGNTTPAVDISKFIVQNSNFSSEVV